MKNDTITVVVGRNFENRRLELPDDSPVAWRHHRLRGQVVREELVEDPDWTIDDPGDVFDEERTHEDVRVVLRILRQSAEVTALTFGETVVYRALEAHLVRVVKKLVKKLTPRLRSGDISRAYVELPDGATVEWSSPGYDGDVDIWVNAKTTLSLEQLDALA